MFKWLFGAPQKSAPEKERPRSAELAKSAEVLEGEILAALEAEEAGALPAARRRERLLELIQEHARTNPEAVAALVRSWTLKGR
jgi:flagellar biosynthesis/type III secretory pathway M-ring protein FliF/YscJ